ncbi:uncharacterized protein LOC133736704 [Rosa rugosa]|uniref:uncharacterized protein LOC133736704 n=1 Tax=Rosa rugosa TaxID=74645 RepID=UPI002B407576|nr:uncharacterized protein LOC133736704 [Rosa rugosa]
MFCLTWMHLTNLTWMHLTNSLKEDLHWFSTSQTLVFSKIILSGLLVEQADVYPKSPCELEGAINWKKVQGYQVVLGIAALKLYLFYVFTVWSRIIVDVVVAILLSRISLIKQQYAWLQFLLGGSVAPMSTDDIDISNIREFLASTVLLNNVERDENLIAALASSLGKDCSGCIKNGELDQSCKKIYLCHDQFKAFVRSNLYICKWFGLSVICVQGLTLLLAIILKALGLYHYYDSDDDYTLERVSLLNCLPPCVFGNTTYGSKYDIWHVLMIIFGDYLWTMYDQPKDNILIGDIELLGVLAIFISALVLGGAHDQLFWYYKSRIMKYLKELAQVFDIKSQMETLVDYQLDTKQIYEESCINGSVTKTKEMQLKAMVIDTSLGSDLDDEAGRPVKVLTDIDQASHACLFAWRTFSIVAFLILGALLISVTHAMSIIAASFVQLSIEVDGYNNDQPLTCIAKITGMSHRIPQVQCHLLEVGRHFRLEVKLVL